MKKSPIVQRNASLKMVPYCVMKNPSEPSLIGSAISYIPLGPTSFSRIHPNSQMLSAMNMSEITRDANAMTVEVVDDMKSANATIAPGPPAKNPYLTGAIAPPSRLLYFDRMNSAQ